MADEVEELKPMREQLNDKMIDVRNEAIMQAANLYLFGRKALLASVGLGVLSVDAIKSLLERAVERGEIAEADAQAMLKRVQQRTAEETKERNEALANMTENASVALSDSANTIMGVLGRGPKGHAARPDEPVPPAQAVSQEFTDSEQYLDAGRTPDADPEPDAA